MWYTNIMPLPLIIFAAEGRQQPGTSNPVGVAVAQPMAAECHGKVENSIHQPVVDRPALARGHLLARVQTQPVQS